MFIVTYFVDSKSQNKKTQKKFKKFKVTWKEFTMSFNIFI